MAMCRTSAAARGDRRRPLQQLAREILRLERHLQERHVKHEVQTSLRRFGVTGACLFKDPLGGEHLEHRPSVPPPQMCHLLVGCNDQVPARPGSQVADH
jgi:hypothetical protein